MYYKKVKKKQYKGRKNIKGYKILFVSLEDPEIEKLIEKKSYEEYLRKLNNEGGDYNG